MSAAVEQAVAAPPRRRLRLAIWLFSRSFSSMLGLVLVTGIVLLALLGPWIVPYPDDVAGAVNLAGKLQPPSWAHWFGTDEVGNDILTRVLPGGFVAISDTSWHRQDAPHVLAKRPGWFSVKFDAASGNALDRNGDFPSWAAKSRQKAPSLTRSGDSWLSGTW